MSEQARRDRRVIEAVRRWVSPVAGEGEEFLAWSAIGWDQRKWMGEPWCGAWASLVDRANGGPTAKYNSVMASSCDRRCGAGPAGSWGALYDPINIVGARGGALAASGALAAGDIITIGESGDPWGRHVTTVVRVLEGGVLAIGGNQTGISVTGERVFGQVALSFYGWDELRMRVAPPGREYNEAAAKVYTVDQLESAREAVLFVWQGERR